MTDAFFSIVSEGAVPVEVPVAAKVIQFFADAAESVDRFTISAAALSAEDPNVSAPEVRMGPVPPEPEISSVPLSTVIGPFQSKPPPQFKTVREPEIIRNVFPSALKAAPVISFAERFVPSRVKFPLSMRLVPE